MRNAAFKIAALICLAASSAVQAAFVAPVSVAIGPNQTDNNGEVINLINDANLTNPFDRFPRPAGGDAAWLDIYRSTGGTLGSDVTFTFDFGADVALADIVIWNLFPNWANTSKSGINEFTLSFATAAEGDTGFGTSIPDTGTFTATRAQYEATETIEGSDSATQTVGSETFDFPDVVVSYVRINVLSNWADGVYAGASEIKFSAPATANPNLVAANSLSFTNGGLPMEYSFVIENAIAEGIAPENLVISNVTASGTAAGSVSMIDTGALAGFPATIAAGTESSIQFNFTPPGPGVHEFSLSIASDDMSEATPRIIPVSIEVVDPVIGVALTTIDLGTFLTAPAPLTAVVTVSNLGGSEDLHLKQATTVIEGASEFTITSISEDGIAPSGTGEIEITFTPSASTAGEVTATLKIDSDDYAGAIPTVMLNAFVFPAAPMLAFDFGTADSPVADGYEQFIAAEDASKTAAGVTVTLDSGDGDITGGWKGSQTDPLLADAAQTTYQGVADNYVSVLLTGLRAGTLNMLCTQEHTYNQGNDWERPWFGEQGGALTRMRPSSSNPRAPYTTQYSTTVEADKTYELRFIEGSVSNFAYIAGLLLWGDAVPGAYTTPFADYVTDAGLDPLSTGAPYLDPDFDHLTTGIEWIVGGSANNTAAPDTGKLPAGVAVNADPDGDLTFSDYLRFTYRRSDAAAADSETTIIVEYGSDLSRWTTTTAGENGVVEVVTPITGETGMKQVDVYIPVSLAPGGELFARLRAEINWD